MKTIERAVLRRWHRRSMPSQKRHVLMLPLSPDQANAYIESYATCFTHALAHSRDLIHALARLPPTLDRTTRALCFRRLLLHERTRFSHSLSSRLRLRLQQQWTTRFVSSRILVNERAHDQMTFVYMLLHICARDLNYHGLQTTMCHL